MKEAIEVDGATGRTAILYLRDTEGRDWYAGAVLSNLKPVRHPGPERRIRDGEGIHVMAITVVED